MGWSDQYVAQTITAPALHQRRWPQGFPNKNLRIKLQRKANDFYQNWRQENCVEGFLKWCSDLHFECSTFCNSAQSKTVRLREPVVKLAVIWFCYRIAKTLVQTWSGLEIFVLDFIPFCSTTFAFVKGKEEGVQEVQVKSQFGIEEILKFYDKVC